MSKEEEIICLSDDESEISENETSDAAKKSNVLNKKRKREDTNSDNNILKDNDYIKNIKDLNNIIQENKKELDKKDKEIEQLKEINKNLKIQLFLSNVNLKLYGGRDLSKITVYYIAYLYGINLERKKDSKIVAELLNLLYKSSAEIFNIKINNYQMNTYDYNKELKNEVRNYLKEFLKNIDINVNLDKYKDVFVLLYVEVQYLYRSIINTALHINFENKYDLLNEMPCYEQSKLHLVPINNIENLNKEIRIFFQVLLNEKEYKKVLEIALDINKENLLKLDENAIDIGHLFKNKFLFHKNLDTEIQNNNLFIYFDELLSKLNINENTFLHDNNFLRQYNLINTKKHDI